VATDGMKAFQEARWQEALDLFRRAESLIHAPTHLLFMARAHVKLVQIVKARELYLKIQREELAPNAPKAFREAQAEAAQELKAIEQRLGYVNIQVQGTDKAQILLDAQRVEPALLGVMFPVDPGPHDITGKAPGMKVDAQRVSVGEGARQTITVAFVAVSTGAPIAPSASPPAGPAPGQVPGETMPAPSPGQADSGPTSQSNGLRIGSYVALGVGVVGLGAGTVFAIQSANKRANADELNGELPQRCGTPCPASDPTAQQIASLDDEARSKQTLATVGFIVGGVGVAAGVTMYLLSRPRKESANSAILPWIGPGSAGVVGRF
jgi:hypothetical protein